MISITAILFIVSFLAVTGLTLTRSPLYGLYAYAATFYLHPPGRWWGEDLPDWRWHLVLGIATFIATLRLAPAPRQSPWLSSTPAMYCLLLCVWMWIQNLWTINPAEHLDASWLFTKYLVLFFLMHRLLDSESKCWGFVHVHVLGCLYLGWLALEAKTVGRLEGVGGPGIDEANSLGMQLCTGVVAAGALVARGPWPSRALGLAALPLMINGIIQTGSRGAFIATVLAGITFLYLSPPRFRRFALAASPVAIAVALPFVPSHYWTRISSINAVRDETVEMDKSAESRIAIAKAQWRMFTRFPMGTGHRGTATLSPLYLDEIYLTRSTNNPDARARSSHNTTLTILVEQGIPGIVLWIWLLSWTAKTSLSLKRILRQTARARDSTEGFLLATSTAMIAGVFIAGQFTDYFKAEVLVWALALLSRTDLLIRDRRAEDHPGVAQPGLRAAT